MFHDTFDNWHHLPTKTANSGRVSSAGGWMLVDGARGGKQTLGADGCWGSATHEPGILRAAHSKTD